MTLVISSPRARPIPGRVFVVASLSCGPIQCCCLQTDRPASLVLCREFALHDSGRFQELVLHGVADGARVLVREHFEPELVHQVFVPLVCGPHAKFDDVVGRTSGCFKDASHMREHPPALLFGVIWYCSRLRVVTEHSARKQLLTPRNKSGDRIVVDGSRLSGNLKTAAAFSHTCCPLSCCVSCQAGLESIGKIGFMVNC